MLVLENHLLGGCVRHRKGVVRLVVVAAKDTKQQARGRDIAVQSNSAACDDQTNLLLSPVPYLWIISLCKTIKKIFFCCGLLVFFCSARAFRHKEPVSYYLWSERQTG